MWGPHPWAPMWGFWWIFPLIGMLLCLTFLALAVRFAVTGRGVMCMAGGHAGASERDTAELRKEIAALREEVARLKARATSG